MPKRRETPVPVEAPPVARAEKPPTVVDWPATLREGPAGVRRWNRLTVAERERVGLADAELAGADLAGIKLGGVPARRADFSGASLAGADLRGADLRGARLAGAVLDAARLDGATFDKDTTWPDGFAIPAEVEWSGRGTDPRFLGKGKAAVAVDIHGLMVRLKTTIDPNRMKRTLDMLKSGRNQIFAEVEPTLVRGIVRSQRDEDLYYSCFLTDDGTYACGNHVPQGLARCMGLSNEPCKHILVLVIGLARAGQIDPGTADRWVVAASAKGPRWNKTTRNHVSDTILKYKGVEAGEVDWRPTETIPEDFYAM